MCLKQFAATLRAEALSAPMSYPDIDGRAVFRHEKTTFRCLNTCAAITAMANKIEKNHKKNVRTHVVCSTIFATCLGVWFNVDNISEAVKKN